MPQSLTYHYNSVAQEAVCAEDAINGLTGILNRLGGSRAMEIDTRGMSDIEATLSAAEAVEDLRNSLELPGRLRDVGVPEEGLELIAAATLKDRSLATNPKPLSDAAPIMQVLRDSW